MYPGHWAYRKLMEDNEELYRGLNTRQALFILFIQLTTVIVLLGLMCLGLAFIDK